MYKKLELTFLCECRASIEVRLFLLNWLIHFFVSHVLIAKVSPEERLILGFSPGGRGGGGGGCHMKGAGILVGNLELNP